MKKKRTKSNRGRKPSSGVLSGMKPDRETWDEIRCRIIYGSAEWRMVALQSLIKNGSVLPSNYLSAPRDVRCSPYTERPERLFPCGETFPLNLKARSSTAMPIGSSDRPKRLRKADHREIIECNSISRSSLC
jgi:hypothetical protein